jgi:internalin A
MTNLIELHLNGNYITDLSPLAGMSKLDILDVTEMDISDLSPIARLNQSTELVTDQCHL